MVVSYGTCGTLSIARNMHLTVLRKQRHFAGHSTGWCVCPLTFTITTKKKIQKHNKFFGIILNFTYPRKNVL